jgi:hypothetical protein
MKDAGLALLVLKYQSKVMTKSIVLAAAENLNVLLHAGQKMTEEHQYLMSKASLQMYCCCTRWHRA